MTRIAHRMELNHRGERDAARRLFAEIWDDIGRETSNPFHRCALAHAMADVQEDVLGELAWDLRALEAADLSRISDELANAVATASTPTTNAIPMP